MEEARMEKHDLRGSTPRTWRPGVVGPPPRFPRKGRRGSGGKGSFLAVRLFARHHTMEAELDSVPDVVGWMVCR